jgi:hypothetical protein
MRVAELEGVQLDYWVAKAEGWEFFWSKHNCWLIKKPGDDQYEAPYIDWTPFDPDTGKPNRRPDPWELMINRNFVPSSDWSQGGPIIEREQISFYATAGLADGMQWCASWDRHVLTSNYGKTALIAAMRAYVASKFGDEIPDAD